MKHPAAVRVVEFAGAGIAAAYAGWLLARMGAQVTRLVSPRPADIRHESPVQLALEVLADGKTSTPCPTRTSALDALLADCDILLCDTPLALETIAGPVNELAARLPGVVLGISSIFGLDGPYAGYPGTALDAQALSAVAWSLGEAGREPLSLPPGIAEHQAGAMLAAGCLMALSVRDEHQNDPGQSKGRVVDVALSEVLASYVAGNCRVYIHHGLKWARSGRLMVRQIRPLLAPTSSLLCV